MNRIYRQKTGLPDEALGHVTAEGKVYETRLGPDRYVGWVDLDTGKIYEASLGPDRYIGQVALDTGKVYLHKPMARDDYLGSIDPDGGCYRHIPRARDERIGSVEKMLNLAHAGAGYLLLLWPPFQAQLDAEAQEKPKA